MDKKTTRLLAPITIAWLVMLVVGLRFERPEFRPWEVLYEPETQRFQASQTVEMEGVGDLGYRSWLRERQVVRTTRFTTDSWGFRNPGDVEAPDIVVLGDSYAAGAGLDDEETLAAQLSLRLGVPVYSYASQSLNTPAMFLSDPRFIEHPPSLVIFAPIARGIMPRRLTYEPPPEEWQAPHNEIADEIRHLIERVNEDNGLIRECRFAYASLRYAAGVRPPEILTPSGNPALVLSLEEQKLFLTPEARHINDVVGWAAVMSQTFQARGTRLLFVPIPDSGIVYPDRFPEAERGRIVTPSFLDVLFERLEPAPVEPIDLREAFRANRETYLYRLDDSHWNANAVALTAEVISGYLAVGE